MKHIIFSTFLIFITTSCAENLGTNENAIFQVIEFSSGPITFSAIKDQVLVPKCIRCHAWVTDEQEVLTRITAGEPESSTLFIRVDSGNMPLGGPELNQNEKRLIYDYIVGITSDTTSVTKPIQTAVEPELFKQVKSQIIEKKCLACHANFNQEQNVLKYISPGSLEGSTFYQLVSLGVMPVGAEKLSEEDILLIEDYIFSL